VLLYHSVSDDPAPGIADFAVSPEVFAEQIAAVVDSGREVVDFAELGARLTAGNDAALENLACVTFDDGWEDNLAAAEILAAHNVPATVFVTTGFIGEDGFLDSAGVTALGASPGIEIGAHTVNHPRLDELSADAVVAELTQSRRELESLVSGPVGTFAYPHGNYDRSVLAAVREAGYSAAAAVKNALSHAGDDPFAVARWTITSGSDAAEVERLLAGEGPVAWKGERLRTRGFRIARKLKRRLT
jgi:peptidoglycan/xylan/chitin deacetylase (PgdA/CDA1 family)